MDSQQLEQINLDSQSLKELQDEIHPQIIEIVKQSSFSKMLENSNNFNENLSNEEFVNRFRIPPTTSINVIITVCWMDDDGNRFCKQVQV